MMSQPGWRREPPDGFDLLIIKLLVVFVALKGAWELGKMVITKWRERRKEG